MKNFSTWLLVMFIAMFWGFRIIVALMDAMHNEFVITPFNSTTEVILLFVVLLCMLLIIKRKMLGAIIYLVAYGGYFGADALRNVMAIFVGESAGLNSYLGTFVSIIGIILPVAVLLDMLADTARKANPRDKKTDWFYQNENFDRKLDERADRNNYRL